ncbi:hypothetical protein [Gracilibacillus lacisalsi]|uniref:hypothetical protein n=1 Tax=Gracilibacillus lacisalsi TaxID=393087 RepID=UPI000363DD3E|nr:hypothetical protein [Gracilibacillus lacisalsi]
MAAIGRMVDVIGRFNRIKYYSIDNQVKVESLERMITDLEDAFEIPNDPYALKEFKKNNDFLYNLYMEIKAEKEETQSAMVSY